MNKTEGRNGQKDAPGGWRHREDGGTGRMEAPGGCAGMVEATMDRPDGQEAWTGWKDTIDGGWTG